MRTKKAAARKTSSTTVPRGDERKARRQDEILAAAFEVFAAHGFEAARIDEVAQRAGVAKGTVYLYFQDKEDLFRAVVRSLIPKRLDVLVKSMPGTSEDLLRGLVSQMYANVVTNPKVRSIVRMLIAESSRFPQLADIYHREIIVPGMSAVREVLKRGVAANEFRAIKAIEFPQIVAAPGLLATVWQLLFSDRHPLNLDAYMQAHLEFVLSSLRKMPDGSYANRTDAARVNHPRQATKAPRS
jgi:AcrR family transcriptional regulator